MFLKSLHIINYRNIGQVDIDLSDGINCFVGQNGAGKTNLLDTVYYMSFCKSFFSIPDSQNIKHGESFMVIQGAYDRNDEEEQIYCGVKSGQKKHFKRNKKDYGRLSDHIGLIPLVIIAPFDELLIAEGGEERRRYADSVISQCDKLYLDNLVKYNRVLQQRNALLKQMQESESHDFSLIDIIDLQLSELGTAVSRERAKFVSWLEPVVSEYYRTISSGRESVTMRYSTGLERYDLYDGLVEARNRDLALGYTSRGIHKDDIEIMLDGYPIKRVGSQGQRKSFVIALKLAQFQYLAEFNGVRPILLLDDVFDKLDDTRGNNLISMVAEGHFDQIFITDTDKKRLQAILESSKKQYKIFDVNNGDVAEQSMV